MPLSFDQLGPSTLPSRGAVAALTGLIGILLFVTVGFLSQSLNIGFGLWFTELFIFLAVPWVLLRFSGRDPLAYVGLPPPLLRPAAYGFLLGTVNFFAVVVPLQYLSQTIAPEWMEQMYDARQLFKDQSPVELALIIGGVSLAAPFCEEFFFRGVIQRGFMPPLVRPVVGVVLTAAVFSAFHLDPVGFLARFELGLLFGLLCLRTGSIWPAVGAHSANNLVSTVLYFAASSPSTAETDAGLLEVLTLAATGAAALAVVLWLPRRIPSLLPQRPLQDAPSAAPARSLWRLVLPWAAAAGVALLLLLAVDSRGVALNYWDSRYALPELEEASSPEALAQREALKELRRQARRGEVPVDQYVEKRRELLPTAPGSL